MTKRLEDLLREGLEPLDDGRAFEDAVLFRASGALHRRRSAAAEEPAWAWLERWARPWVVAAVAVAALAVGTQALRPAGTDTVVADASPVDALLAPPLVDVVLALASGN